MVFTNDMNSRVKYSNGSADYKKTFIKQDITIGANVTVVCRHNVRHLSLQLIPKD